MPHGADGRSWLYRLGPSAVAALLFLGFALLWQFDRPLYVAAMGQYIWTTPFNIPFNDIGPVLRAAACWHHGVDVYVPDACQGGGTFNYAPLLLRIGLLGIGASDQVSCGLVLCLLFLAACTLLPPVRTCSEFLLRCLVL